MALLRCIGVRRSDWRRGTERRCQVCSGRRQLPALGNDAYFVAGCKQIVFSNPGELHDASDLGRGRRRARAMPRWMGEAVAAMVVAGLFSHPMSKPQPNALVCPHYLAKPLVFSQWC